MGKKIQSWGTADWLNPTDILSPWDYTELYSDIEEFKLGITTLEFDFYMGNWVIKTLLLPAFSPSRYPMKRVEQFIPVEGDSIRMIFDPDIIERPESNLKNIESTVRIQGVLKGFDFSLFYFTGFDRNPDLSVSYGWETFPASGPPDSVLISLKYPPLKVIGGDFSTVWKSWEIHGEGAYYITEDRKGEDPAVKNSFYYVVIGGTKSTDRFLFGMQYGFKFITNYKPILEYDFEDRYIAQEAQKINFETDRWINYLTLRISYEGMEDRLKLDGPLVYDLTNGDYFSLPRITYEFSDGVEIMGGFLLTGGKGYSPFSQMGKYLGKVVFLEGRYYF